MKHSQKNTPTIRSLYVAMPRVKLYLNEDTSSVRQRTFKGVIFTLYRIFDTQIIAFVFDLPLCISKSQCNTLKFIFDRSKSVVDIRVEMRTTPFGHDDFCLIMGYCGLVNTATN